jgi:glycosyltransferase involved in cell wall biosynthesis
VAVSAAVAAGSQLARSAPPFRVIPNFIPDRLWADAGRPAPAAVDGLRDAPFVLFVGDLSRDKGVHVLLEAWSQFRERPSLVLIGRRCADTPAVPPGVTVIEDAPHELVMRAFRRCAVATAPSVWPDPCPTAVLEAMAAGRALVTTPSGGIADMVMDMESGLLVPPGDAGRLAGALRLLLGDAALRRRLGEEARRRARSFTAAFVVPRIEAVYRAVVQGER